MEYDSCEQCQSAYIMFNNKQIDDRYIETYTCAKCFHEHVRESNKFKDRQPPKMLSQKVWNWIQMLHPEPSSPDQKYRLYSLLDKLETITTTVPHSSEEVENAIHNNDQYQYQKEILQLSIDNEDDNSQIKHTVLVDQESCICDHGLPVIKTNIDSSSFIPVVNITNCTESTNAVVASFSLNKFHKDLVQLEAANPLYLLDNISASNNDIFPQFKIIPPCNEILNQELINDTEDDEIPDLVPSCLYDDDLNLTNISRGELIELARLVKDQVQCSLSDAIETLIENKGDVVLSIMKLGSLEPGNDDYAMGKLIYLDEKVKTLSI